MNTRSREKIGPPKQRTLSDSSPSSSSASSSSSESDGEDDDTMEGEERDEIIIAKNTAASLEVLQLSDEDEGPRIGSPSNTSAEDDLESIDSQLLFRSSPPPATPSTSKASMGSYSRGGGTPGTLKAVPKREPSPNQSNSKSPLGMGRKNVRKLYHTLIENCQEFEEKEGFDVVMENRMRSNIGRGQKLFDEIGGGPGDMFLAFFHTRVCSGMLKYKTVNIGNSSSAFKVDLFLNSLMEKCLTSDGEYLPRQAVKCISSSATDCCRTLNPMIMLVGAIDRLTVNAPGAKEKEKKQRARKRQFDDTVTQTTHHEVMKMTSTERISTQKTNHESVSREILEVLKQECGKSASNSINLFEFILDKNSFASTIESMFFVAFLVRDGNVRLYREDNQPNHDYTISIRPDKAPENAMLQDPVRKGKKKK